MASLVFILGFPFVILEPSCHYKEFMGADLRSSSHIVDVQSLVIGKGDVLYPSQEGSESLL